MSDYDPKAARAKRPCPIWVDALLRDCGDLGPAEIGAYLLIIFKMWSNRECGVPAHDRALATIARISLASWRRNMSPRLARFFHERDGWLYQKRLLIEAAKVEAFCATQHRRKSRDYPRLDLGPTKSKAYPKSGRETFAPPTPQKLSGLNPPKRLESLTSHTTGDDPGIHPSQEANSTAACASPLDFIPEFEEALELVDLLERVERILGRETTSLISFCTLPEWLISWRRAGANDFDIIVALIGWARRDRRSAPSSPGYFTRIIEDATKRRTTERTEREDPDEKSRGKNPRKRTAADHVAAFLSAAECFDD